MKALSSKVLGARLALIATLASFAVFCGTAHSEMMMSINGFRNQDTTSADPSLLGHWVDVTAGWAGCNSIPCEFDISEDATSVNLKFHSGDKDIGRASFTASFVEIGAATFVALKLDSSDCFGKEGSECKIPLAAAIHLLPVYSIWRIEVDDDTFSLHPLEPEKADPDYELDQRQWRAEGLFIGTSDELLDWLTLNGVRAAGDDTDSFIASRSTAEELPALPVPIPPSSTTADSTPAVEPQN